MIIKAQNSKTHSYDNQSTEQSNSNISMKICFFPVILTRNSPFTVHVFNIQPYDVIGDVKLVKVFINTRKTKQRITKKLNIGIE